MTATAAIDTGKYTPDSTVNGRNGIIGLGGAAAERRQQELRPITLTHALTNSVNTVCAQVAEQVGKRDDGRYMKRFGFYRKPPLDYPAEEMSASGEHLGGRRRSRRRARWSTSAAWASARTSSQVTPLQMARSPPRSPTAAG